MPNTHCRKRGLTPEGEILVQTQMDKGMLIDLAHLPERGILRAYQCAQNPAGLIAAPRPFLAALG